MYIKSMVLTAALLLVIGGGLVWYTHPAMAPVTKLPTQTQDTPQSSGKLNINVVCKGALAYMTFPDGASADKFVAECEAGQHPEVIERYKADHNLTGATI